MSEVDISLEDFLSRVKEQRNGALDSAAQAWAAIDSIRAGHQKDLELKDLEIARLKRLIENSKSIPGQVED